MTELEHLYATKEWANKWLSTAESDLPGTLTHEKCLAVLEDVEDKLIEYLGVTLGDGGELVLRHIE